MLGRVSGSPSTVFSDCNALNKVQVNDSIHCSAVVVHTFNPQGPLSSKPAGLRSKFQESLGLHRGTLSQESKRTGLGI